jgi:hypothetical protein
MSGGNSADEQKSLGFSAAPFGHLRSSDWAPNAEASEHVRCSDGELHNRLVTPSQQCQRNYIAAAGHLRFSVEEPA